VGRGDLHHSQPGDLDLEAVALVAGVRDQLRLDLSLAGIVVGLLALDAQKFFGQGLPVVCASALWQSGP
jgi:hypothetical protein